MLNFSILIFLVVIGLVLFSIIKRGKFSGGSSGNVVDKKLPGSGIKNYTYELKSFLSPAERSFYGVLLRIVGDQYLVFAKIRVADILSPAMLRSKSRSEWQKAFNSISSKHFDFVICNLESVKAQYVIELDDSSHNGLKANDKFKDAICKSASLPLIRIKASHAYSTESIKDQIESVITSES